MSLHSTKFAQLFSLLSQKEAEAFQQFIELPYLKVALKSKNIFNTIYSNHWESKGKKSQKAFPKREALQKQYFPDKGKNFHELNKRFSNLHTLLQQFLALESAIGDKKQLDKISSNFALNRGGYHYTEVVLNRREKELNQKSETQFEAYLVAETKDKLQYKKQSSKRTTTLQQVAQNLDDFYFVTKLKNQCLQLSRKITSNDTAEKTAAFESYLTEYKNSNNRPSLLFQFYDNAHQLLREINPIEAINRLRKLMIQHKNEIQSTDCQIIRDIIFNYYTRQFNQNKIPPITVLREYQGLLREKTLVSENGDFQTNYYRNIVAVAIQAKDPIYARQFCISYKERLNSKDQENAFEYSLASCDFAEHRWTEAMIHAEQIEGNDFKFSRGSLLLRSAFEHQLEIGGEEEILKQYDFQRVHRNFATQLRRHPKKQRGKQFIAYKNFTKYLGELNSIYYDVNTKKERIVKFQEDLAKETLVAAKSWLLEKIRKIN